LECVQHVIRAIKRRRKCGGHVTLMVGHGGGGLVEKLQGKRHIGKPRRRWEDDIKMGVQAVGWWSWTG